MAVQGILQISDLLFQFVDGLSLLEDVFFVDITQLDFCHVISLDLIDTKADHQIGNNLIFQFGFPDDADGLIDIQQDPLQALQQVEAVFLLLDLEEQAALDAIGTPGGPLLQNLTDTHNPGHTGNEDIKVTGETVLQGSHTEKLLHQLFRLNATL